MGSTDPVPDLSPPSGGLLGGTPGPCVHFLLSRLEGECLDGKALSRRLYQAMGLAVQQGNARIILNAAARAATPDDDRFATDWD